VTESDLIVLKIGGSVAGEDAAALDAIASLHDAGHSLAVVHGGGPLVGEWAAQLGYETKFLRGLRVTDGPTRDLALAVLGGLANARIVAALLGRSVPAVGLTGIDGGMLRAQREDSELGLVGNIRRVDSALLEELIDAGRVPVVAPAALEEPAPAGEVPEVLNVNADSAAGAIAASLGARLLVFVTDVPGVRAKDGKLVTKLDRERAKELVDDGTIEGGMLPKVEACLIASAAGCRAAIVEARAGDAVERLLAGERVGTVFEAA
jgi:acetylglutamate kinase